MNIKALNILLADDDRDDCSFFKDALDELQLSTSLTVVHDGEQLMQILTNENNELPQILFLDINMPRKNGFECLSEIKQHETLKDLPVIIFSTSLEQEVVNLLYANGARYFIRKPADFALFKEIILHTLKLILQQNNVQPSREEFVLRTADSFYF
jgi:CheY-like chemotaxis protein